MEVIFDAAYVLFVGDGGVNILCRDNWGIEREHEVNPKENSRELGIAVVKLLRELSIAKEGSHGRDDLGDQSV